MRILGVPPMESGPAADSVDDACSRVAVGAQQSPKRLLSQSEWLAFRRVSGLRHGTSSVPPSTDRARKLAARNLWSAGASLECRNRAGRGRRPYGVPDGADKRTIAQNAGVGCGGILRRNGHGIVWLLSDRVAWTRSMAARIAHFPANGENARHRLQLRVAAIF